MEPILDETSLVPCMAWAPGKRIALLASLLQGLDRVGAPRVLRSVRDAAERDIGQGRGLISWCSDRAINRDARLLVASRLSKQPFIDGDDGLFAAVEGERLIEATVDGQVVFGLALAGLNDTFAVALGRADRPKGGRVTVIISSLDGEEETTLNVDVLRLVNGDDVAFEKDFLEAALDQTLKDGVGLLSRAHELFPNLRFGARAEAQITDLTGTELVFRQLIRHLRSLNMGAETWGEGPYLPANATTWSDESKSTLDHGRYGPMRDFPTPAGFPPSRWRLHTKLTGGRGARLYFRPERTPKGPVVLIGYFGPHLSTVKYPT